MSDLDQVTLQTGDGREFKVNVKLAKMSATIADLIEDSGVDAPVPVPNLDGRVMEKVIQWCLHHVDDPVEPVAATDAAAAAEAAATTAAAAAAATKEEPGRPTPELRTDEISSWDLDYCKVDQSMLFDMILAANFLAIPKLLRLTCKTVANMCKGKAPEDIRRTFNVTGEFTPEEERLARLENSWAEEKVEEKK